MMTIIAILLTVLIAVPVVSLVVFTFTENVLELPRYTFLGVLFNKKAILKYAINAVDGYETNITKDKKTNKVFYAPENTNLFNLLMAVTGNTSIAYDDKEAFIYRYYKTVDSEIGVVIRPSAKIPTYISGEATVNAGIILAKSELLEDDVPYIVADRVHVFKKRTNPHPLKGNYVKDKSKMNYLTFASREIKLINVKRRNNYETKNLAAA